MHEEKALTDRFDDLTSQVEYTGGDNGQKRLYDLIWKRTIASQMADAQLERTTVTIDISKAGF